jgi:hypothetical protein
MNAYEMVLGIVLISGIASVLRAKYGVVRRHKGEMFVGNTGQSDAETARMRDEIKTLKERIAVLERLATDNNSAAALDREIEKLR